MNDRTLIDYTVQVIHQMVDGISVYCSVSFVDSALTFSQCNTMRLTIRPLALHHAIYTILQCLLCNKFVSEDLKVGDRCLARHAQSGWRLSAATVTAVYNKQTM
jgi:hypothetical protein